MSPGHQEEIVSITEESQEMAKYFICPHCGAEVQVNDLVCPECGSDEKTGWSKDTSYDEPSLDEDDESSEFHSSSEKDGKSPISSDSSGVLWFFRSLAAPCRDGKSPVPSDSLGVPWVTYVVIAVSTMLCLYFNMGKEFPGYKGFTEVLAPSALRMWAGGYWGLMTSAFVHIAFWHLLFNMWCARDFGRIIEPTMGSAKYSIFLMASAIVSSGAQLAFSAQTGIGFSGVVYAMFGYGLTARHIDPRYLKVFDIKTIRWLIGWLVLCIILSVTKLWNVGNAAHVGGFFFGIFVGNIFIARRYTVLSKIGLLLLFAVTILSVTYMPWSKRWKHRDVIAKYIESVQGAKAQDIQEVFQHLSQHLEEYKKLVSLENAKGQSYNQQIIIVIQKMMDDITELELFYQAFQPLIDRGMITEMSPDVLQQAILNGRKLKTQLQDELSNRQ